MQNVKMVKIVVQGNYIHVVILIYIKVQSSLIQHIMTRHSYQRQ